MGRTIMRSVVANPAVKNQQPLERCYLQKMPERKGSPEIAETNMKPATHETCDSQNLPHMWRTQLLKTSSTILFQMAANRHYAVRKQALIAAARGLEKLSVELRHAQDRITQLEAQEKIARLDLSREQARLNWLLPRQHTHQTRQSIDNEL